jgi:dethiobiotin synthase
VSLFITGTDTGVGKTHTAARLLQLLRASGASCAGMKPICCGDRRDAERLLAAGSDGLTIDDVNPVWLKTPAAPIVGSLMEKVDISIDRILAAFHSLQNRVEHVIVEETGGWIVPIPSQLFRQRSGRDDEAASPGGCIQSARLPQSRGPDCAKHPRTRVALLRACIEQRSRNRRYRRSDQCRYSQENSRCSSALWTRRKSYRIAY